MKGFGDMLKQAQKMKREMDDLQKRLAEERFEAAAGGGLVRVVVDGKQMLREIKLDPKLLQEQDVTLIEDLVLTAVGEAQGASEKKMHEALSKLAGGMPLPF
jgi:DNA-binding YbaB/EbfC family protein